MQQPQTVPQASSAEGTTKYRFFKKERILPISLAVGAFCLMTFIVTPFLIYATNLSEFQFSLRDFMPFSALVFLVAFALFGAILMALPNKIFPAAILLFSAATFFLFVQGTYLNLGLSSLTQDNVGTSADAIETSSFVINGLIWGVFLAAVLAVGILLTFRWKKTEIVRLVSIFLSVIVIGVQLVTFLSYSLSVPEAYQTKEERMKNADAEYYPYVMTTDNLTAFGSSRNVLIFCIDRFDERFAEYAYEWDADRREKAAAEGETVEGEQLFSTLDGFTWYQDNISLYGHTFPSIANMLTRKEYLGTAGRTEYLNVAYAEESVLSEFAAKGYGINLYTQVHYSFSDAFFLPRFVENVVPADTFRAAPLKYQALLTMRMAQMTMYRNSPYLTKSWYDNIDSDSCNAYVRAAREAQSYSADNDAVAGYVNESEFTVSDGERHFAFIHTAGCHSINFDNTHAQMYDEVAECMELVYAYIDALKAAGLYEDATIIITGDHASPRSDYRSIEDTNSTRRTALFVKRSGDAGTPLVTSKAQVSHEQLWAEIYQSEGLTSEYDLGRSFRDTPEGVDQVRRYIWQTYKRGSLDEYIYTITGDGSKLANWHRESLTHYDKFLMDD